MGIKASDLDYSTRQQILSNVRKQLGSDTYDNLEMQIGEDGILNAVLEQAGKSSASRSTTSSSEKETNIFYEALQYTAIGLTCCGAGVLVTNLLNWLYGWLVKDSDEPPGCVFVAFLLGIILNVLILGPAILVLAIPGYIVVLLIIAIVRTVKNPRLTAFGKVLTLAGPVLLIVAIFWFGGPPVWTMVGQYWNWVGQVTAATPTPVMAK